MDSKYITAELTLLTLLSGPYTVVNMGDILHIIVKSLVCRGFADQPAWILVVQVCPKMNKKLELKMFYQT